MRCHQGASNGPVHAHMRVILTVGPLTGHCRQARARGCVQPPVALDASASSGASDVYACGAVSSAVIHVSNNAGVVRICAHFKACAEAV